MSKAIITTSLSIAKTLIGSRYQHGKVFATIERLIERKVLSIEEYELTTFKSFINRDYPMYNIIGENAIAKLKKELV